MNVTYKTIDSVCHEVINRPTVVGGGGACTSRRRLRRSREAFCFMFRLPMFPLAVLATVFDFFADGTFQ